ncbi:UNVERIFIED_CONTAM: hypothetical protein Sradi_3170300 [Sesamum radiatum]|uniref:Reverse transcriptase zinc-binding domain-containing protein n=1 Tax=Sesamum radiatum TaxID=300843 RepID=A0AAW2RGS9_SESRA
MEGVFHLWTDIWHPRGPLSHSFPRGPMVTGLPLDSLLRSVINHGEWNWPSARNVEIQEIIAGLPPIHHNQPDSIIWKARDGKFTTASAVTFLQPPSAPADWQWLLGGRFKIPRHDFILWLALLERLTTMDRIWLGVHDPGCVLCGGATMETHEHLFFQCPFSAHCIQKLKSVVRFQWLGCGWRQDTR